MLQGLFNYDNPVWRFIGKLGDLILLNILWIICSIPIVTCGAATTAVYYVTLKLSRDEGDSTIKSFFRSFKNNFKQATVIWLILLAVGILLGFDFWFFLSGQMAAVQGALRLVICAVFGALLLIYLFVLAYVFPLQARFYNTVKRTFFNALFMSVRHLLQTLGILVADVSVVGIGYLSLFYFPQLFLLLLLFGAPLIFFMNSYFFTPIFRRYTPEEKEHREAALPPLLDDDNSEVEAAIRGLRGEDRAEANK